MPRQVASGTTGGRAKSSANRSNETSHGTPRLATNVPENVGTAYRQTGRKGRRERRADLVLTDPAARFAVFASLKSTRGRTYEPFCIIVVFVLKSLMENDRRCAIT